jgi:arginine-tRNA-protein transferase
MTASLREIKVYTTFPHRCSYLPGEEATTLFVDPRQKLSQELYTQLSLLGPSALQQV